jgi:hypothetical protein
MTPQEAAEFARADNREKVKEFLFSATARDIQEFIHLTPAFNTTQVFNLARVALDVRLADDQAKASEQLERHTRVLVDIAKSLLEESKLLRWLTVGLFVLTAGLLIFTICSVIHP